MSFIFDNLIAVFVSMTLAVTLLSQQTSVRQDALERQSVYHAKAASLTLAEWLEDDVVRLGARFGSDRDRFSFVQRTVDGELQTREFVYYYNTRAIDEHTAERIEVRYRLAATERVRTSASPADTTTIQFYRLVRAERAGQYRRLPGEAGDWVGVPPSWIQTPGYGSPHGLRSFLVQPVDSNNQPVTDPADADYVQVRFAVVPTLFPLSRARLVPKSGLFWATTVEIRPF